MYGNVDGGKRQRWRRPVAVSLLIVALACSEESSAPGGADDAPGLLGVRLGMDLEAADGILRELLGSGLVPRDELHSHHGIPVGLPTDQRPLLFGKRVSDLAVLTRPGSKQIEAVVAQLGDFQSTHSDCNGETVEAVHDWALQHTGHAEPRFESATLGALTEEIRRFPADDFFVDTVLLHGSGWCMSFGLQLGAAGFEGPFDRRKAFLRMAGRAEQAEGFLSGEHGIYVPDCQASAVDSARYRNMEYTIWSEGELAYLNVGRVVEPGEAQLVEARGLETFAVGGQAIPLQRYRLLDVGGKELEIAIGNDRLGFVLPDGEITELLQRCPAWRR